MVSQNYVLCWQYKISYCGVYLYLNSVKTLFRVLLNLTETSLNKSHHCIVVEHAFPLLFFSHNFDHQKFMMHYDCRKWQFYNIPVTLQNMKVLHGSHQIPACVTPFFSSKTNGASWLWGIFIRPMNLFGRGPQPSTLLGAESSAASCIFPPFRPAGG